MSRYLSRCADAAHRSAHIGATAQISSFGHISLSCIDFRWAPDESD
jgi:hypothetical protein